MNLFSFLVGCTRPAHSLVDISETNEAGWHDLGFEIIDYTKQSDSSQSFILAGTHKGKRVSIRAILSPTWQFRPKDAQLPIDTYRGVVTFESSGPESDAFLAALDELYRTRTGATSCINRVQFTGITLGGDPNRALDGELSIKLFYEPEDETKYAEAYFNILYPKKRAQFHEKDPEYRTNIVYAFTKKQR